MEWKSKRKLGILSYFSRACRLTPMTLVAEFDDIRPYNDDEVKPTLKRLLADNEFIDAIAKLKMPKVGHFAVPFLRSSVRKRLARESAQVETVEDFQLRIKPYLGDLLKRTTAGLTVSGLDQLPKSGAYLFISNHRDIAMDPAVVNWVLNQYDYQTLRIAIGDNLLTKPFAADLMRLNKCFIVNRSASAPREKLKAARQLSSYIRHSLLEDHANIWIAQREGRAKDSLDITNQAILSMIAMAKQKQESFGDYLNRICMIPVSISYEWDPCDQDKARELTILEQQGSYKKSEHEDVQSIAKGILGKKGRVHLAFGQRIPAALESAEATAKYLDKVMIEQYVLQPSHCAAYELIEGKAPELPVTDQAIRYSQFDARATREQLQRRLQECPPAWRSWFLKIYANPVYAALSAQTSS